MKRIYTLFLFISLALAAAVSCKKPVDPVDDNKDPEEITDPEKPEEPTPLPADPKLAWASWLITTSDASSATGSWTNDNKFFALSGEGKGKAFISTSTTAASSSAARGVNSNRIGVNGLGEGDCIEFTLPSQTLAAGSTVDFMVNLMATSNGVPKYWIFEYEKDGVWVPEETKLKATEDPSLSYSFYIKYFSAYQYTTFTTSFSIDKDIKDAAVKMRIRAVGKVNGSGGTLSADTSAWVCFLNSTWIGARITTCQGIPAKDSKSILVLGNSFTYYHSTNFQLMELARSQGHALKMTAHIKGSQSFSNHLSLERSTAAINCGPFDYALLQDQSVQHSNYYQDPTKNTEVVTNTKSLLTKIKAVSPSVQPIIENTWAFMGSDNYNGFGSYEAFDKALEGGALLVTSECNTWMSPIRLAFEKARAKNIANLYHTDNKHPGTTGSYLKACVNYLLIYGEPFDSHASDCNLTSSLAAQLRSIAEETVLGTIQGWRNPDASGVVPGNGGNGGDTPVEGETLTISTADELIAFAQKVNGGDESAVNAKVALGADITLPSTAWTPIGSVTGVGYSSIATPTVAFKGTFDGKGHSINGLVLSVKSNDVTCMGFFGATDGATIRNLSFNEATMDFTSSGISSGNISIGTVAGYAYDTVIEDVDVTASFTGAATSTAARHVAVGGIAGTVAASDASASSVTRCTFSGSITSDIGSKYSNSSSAVVSGIVASVPNTSSCKTVLIKDCVNKATINTKSHRAAGIIGNAFHVHVEGCVNEGDITCNQSSSAASGSVAGTRMGGILAYCSSTSTNDFYLQDCVNKGTVSTSSADSACGGIAGLIRTFTLTGCKNSGNVFAPAGGRGLMVGRNTSSDVPSTYTNCAIRGKVGDADGSNAVEATADNYLSLGITFGDGVTCPSWNAENIKFLTENL